MKNIIKTKGAGFLINMIVVLIDVLGFIFYLVSADDKSGMTETKISVLVIVMFVLAILMGAVTLFYRNDLIKVLLVVVQVGIVCFWAFSQADYIVNVLIGTDGNVFGAPYILSVVMMIADIPLSLFTRIKPKSDNPHRK